MRALLALCLLAGCLRSTQFNCERDLDCSGGGRCEDNGACSFEDASCDSGSRFDSSAGSLASTCVPVGGVPADARTDGAIDAPSGNCPSGYQAIANGMPGHLYRLVDDEDTWLAMRDECAGDHATRTFLAVPRSAQQLAAISALNGSNKLWLGIDDRTTDGVFVGADGSSPTFLPWKSGSPSGGGNDNDCVAADSATEIIDDDCEQEYAAVCECED